MNSTDYQVNLLRERIRELETRMLQLEDRVVFYPPAQLQQEPEAFVTSLTAGPDGVARSGLDRVLPLMAGVYLTPQSAQRKPLTDEMDKRAAHIEDYSRRDWFITGWLQAEAAHGIKS